MGFKILIRISVAAEGETALKNSKKNKTYKKNKTSSKPQIFPDSSVAITGASDNADLNVFTNSFPLLAIARHTSCSLTADSSVNLGV